MHLGPLKRTIFPYEFHFRAINTHVFVTRPLGIDAESDANMILEALRQGHCFIGYDLPASTRGFTFTAQGLQQSVQMGDELDSHGVSPSNACRDARMCFAEGWQTCAHLA
jgi:hypothetical protein